MRSSTGIGDIVALHTLSDLMEVVDLQREIWGRDYDDVVPLSVLAATIKRGGLLLGPRDGMGALAGFVFSWPGVKAGRTFQWSHMLGVAPRHRGSHLGLRLKLAQRDRTIAMGMDLIEWTFDPLLTVNAHLNVTRLGAVVSEYLENIYGASASPLHLGAPTDRFVASWHILSPHVERRIAAVPELVARDAQLRDATVVLAAGSAGRWSQPDGAPMLDATARRLIVEVPVGFASMLAEAPALAQEWRAVTRAVFTTYFASGYRVVDFLLDSQAARSAYLLTREGESA